MSLLRKDRRCFGCKKYLQNCDLKHEVQPDEVTTMKTCSSCDTASFCTSKCQKSNWNKHKKVCLRMKSLRGEIDFLIMESQGQLRNTEATLEMNKVFARVMQGMENQCNFFNPVKAIQDSQLKYLDRRISMAYAIWHLLEVSDNYETCQKFCQLTEEILEDDDKLIHLNDDKKPTKLIYYLIFAYLKLGQHSKAHFLIKTTVINFLLFVGNKAGKFKPKKVQEAKDNIMKNDLKENIIEVTKKFLSNYPQHIWKNYWHMMTVTFLPGMIATKLNVILELMKRKEDAKNFAEVYNSEDGGTFYQFNNNYPIVIQQIKSYLLGYDTHRKFVSVLRKQKSDLKEYIEHGNIFCFLKSTQLLDYDSKHEHCRMMKNGTFLEYDSESEHATGQGTGLAIPMEQSAESYFQTLFKTNSVARELVKDVYEELGTADAPHSCCGCSN